MSSDAKTVVRKKKRKVASANGLARFIKPKKTTKKKKKGKNGAKRTA